MYSRNRAAGAEFRDQRVNGAGVRCVFAQRVHEGNQQHPVGSWLKNK